MKKIVSSFFAVCLVLGAVGCSSKAKNESFDVVVIGSGGAGLTAAVEAKQQGANVIVFEKMGLVGGNTARATGGMNAAETEQQKTLGIEDSVDVMFEDTMKGGKNINNPELVTILAENSASAVAWLTDLGADLSDVGALGGATNKRAHRPTGGAKVGDHMVSVLKKATEDLKIEIRVNTEVTEIITKDGVITGVKIKDKSGEKTVETKAVIIASGGFGANAEMFSELNPKLEGFSTTNQSGALGEGIRLAESLNAQLVDMEQIQTHPTVEVTTSEMITEAVRGEGAVLINRDGERFINEMLTRDVVSEAILKQTEKTAFLVFNEEVRKNLKAVESYINLGFVVEAKSLEELATTLELDQANLEKTVAAYQEAIKSGNDSLSRTSFGKVTFTEGPWYAIEVAPAVHHTMGGLVINGQAEVLDKDGQVIKGLYAAGEVTGGIHGANRLGGNALADIVVFGRIAADSAIQFTKGE